MNSNSNDRAKSLHILSRSINLAVTIDRLRGPCILPYGTLKFETVFVPRMSRAYRKSFLTICIKMC